MLVPVLLLDVDDDDDDGVVVVVVVIIRTGPSMTGINGAAGPCQGRGLPLRHLIGGPPDAMIAFSTQS